jgi:hypothetical protein
MAEKREDGAGRSMKCWHESPTKILGGAGKPRIPWLDLSSGMAENPTRKEEAKKYPKPAGSLEQGEENPGEI